MPVHNQKPIARWDSARDAWIPEAEHHTLQIFEPLGAYSETFMTSGSMRNGVVYELPKSVPHTAGFEFSCSPPGEKKLPTPRSNEANGIGEHGTGGADLRTTVALLPTPRSADHTHSMDAPAARKHVEDGNGALAETLGYHLLPIPKAGDADFGMPRTSGRPPEKSTHLATRLAYTSPNAMLPTPRATRGGSATEMAYGFGGERSDERRSQGVVELPESASWGPYGAAIARWEQVLGRPAPDPTEEGPKGGRRLSALFVEWMMGLPQGWVTDSALGLSRTQQLKMLGNGVVTRQALEALRQMTEVAG